MSALLLGSVSIAFATMRGSSRIIGAWGKAMLLLAVGLLGLALRGTIPDWVSAAAGNTAIVGGLVLAMRGLRLFLGGMPKDAFGWGLTAALFLYLVYFTEIRPSHEARTIAISVALLVISVRAALLLQRKAPPECKLSCRFAEFIFWTTAVMTLLRIVGTVLIPPANTLT